MDEVFSLMTKEKGFSFGLISKEIDYFYNDLGIDWAYFKYATPLQISKHIHALIAAKKVADIGGKGEHISFERVKDHSATFITSKSGFREVRNKMETQIDKMSSNYAVNLILMRSHGTIKPGGKENLWLCFGHREPYENPDANKSDDVQITASTQFIKNTPKSVI